MFLSDHIASFARKKKQEEPKRRTWRDNIIGTTNAGKAFRVGALASGVGLGTLALKNKTKLTAIAKNPRRFYTSKVNGKDTTTIKRKKKVVPNPDYDVYLASDNWTKKVPDEYVEVFDKDWHDVRRTEKDKRSFSNTGRKLRWGRVGKTAALGAGALSIPTGMAYVAGTDKDREDIDKRLNKSVKTFNNTSEGVRKWINTLHRVSR